MTPIRSTKLALRGLSAIAGAALVFGVSALPASAHHADEKVEVSKTTDLTEGESVKVTFSGFTAGGKQAKAVIAGQGELTTIPDKLNFDEYANAPAVDVASDGTGSFDLVVISDHGTVQDGTTLDCKIQQCWIIVVQEPFLPQPNYDSVPITFAGGAVTPPTTAAASTETTVVTAESTAAPATTAAPAEAATTTAPEATTTTVAAVAADETAGDDEGGSGALYAIIAAVVVVLGAGGFFIARRKPPVG